MEIGARKFYSEGQTPDDMLYQGDYQSVPILFGANSHEGSYVYGVVYNEYIIPNNLIDDQEFFKNEFIHVLMKTVGVTNSYAVEHMIEDAYFEDWMMGDLDKMQPGLIDLLRNWSQSLTNRHRVYLSFNFIKIKILSHVHFKIKIM